MSMAFTGNSKGGTIETVGDKRASIRKESYDLSGHFQTESFVGPTLYNICMVDTNFKLYQTVSDDKQFSEHLRDCIFERLHERAQ